MRPLPGSLAFIVIALPMLVAGSIPATSEPISPPWSCMTTSTMGKPIFAQRNEDLHIVWVESRPTGSEVYYYKYINASRKWSTGVSLTEGAHAKDAVISGDYKGNLHVVWQDGGRLFHRLWNVTSQEWQEPYLVAEEASNPILLCDKTPNAHVIWIQSSPGQDTAFLSHRYLDSNGRWSEPIHFSPESAYCTEPALAVDERNGLHVVWKMTYDRSKPYDMYYATRRAGRDWEPFQKILDGSKADFSDPSIAADKNGFLHLVWSQHVGNESLIYYRAWRGSWEEPIAITEPPSCVANPVIAIDDGLNGHLVWEDARDHPGSDIFELYYARLWPQGVWSLPQRLTDEHAPSNESTPPRIEVSPTTRDLHIVWSELRDGMSRVFHKTWPGLRREDVASTASKARTSLAEVQRQPFVSRQAQEKYEEALAAYRAGLDSLREFDVSAANENFLRCVHLLEEGKTLEEEHKERMSRRMGTALAFSGVGVGAAILIAWAALRRAGA